MNYQDDKELRQRVLRIIAGSLLSSDLSEDDFGRLSLILNQRLFDDVVSAINNINGCAAPLIDKQAPRQTDPKATPKTPHLTLKPTLRMFQERVRAKKISYQRLKRYIEDVIPEFSSRQTEVDASIVTLLEEFLEHSSTAQIQKLLDRIVGPVADDPYLTGITNKR